MNIILLIVGFYMLIKCADIFVESSSNIAKALKIPSIIIGLTIVGRGTSAPEAAVSVIAAINGNYEVATGNVIGSNIFNTIGILGISTVLNPVTVTMVSIIDITVLLFVTILLFSFMFKKELNKKHGMIFVLIYLLYMTYLIIPYI